MQCRRAGGKSAAGLVTMPKVNPEILVWARETAGLAPDAAARKLGFRDTGRGIGSGQAGRPWNRALRSPPGRSWSRWRRATGVRCSSFTCRNRRRRATGVRTFARKPVPPIRRWTTACWTRWCGMCGRARVWCAPRWRKRRKRNPWRSSHPAALRPAPTRLWRPCTPFWD